MSSTNLSGDSSCVVLIKGAGGGGEGGSALSSVATTGTDIDLITRSLWWVFGLLIRYKVAFPGFLSC
jgi:hypothetical protein